MAKTQDKATAKAAKKETRAAKRAKGKATRSQLKQAFDIQRKRDKALIPIMIACVLGGGLLFFLLGMWWGWKWFWLVMGLIAGAVLAMFIFSRRLEKSMYDEVGDTPGAAGWTLENMRNTMGIVWLTKTGVQANTHMDTVHRVVGNPGVVLVGEGDQNRLKSLMAKEHKRVDRLLAGVPIYEVYAGEGEGQVRNRDLQKHLLKLPKNYQKNEVYNLSAKLDAMDSRQRPGQMAGLPGGPLPKQAQNMSGMNRKMRRMQERKGGK
ncbi:DUF4191 domain-containing protein [Corynebacterium lujinxingii]|uniref:DUF4191 domain-containing protein n=1 Tax=Corynebacterium lujinxingii TaxID=2763010 RepID=A0A7H0JXA7_9CORY|nr:DUF4191 domain-containing protein [Corynebacterium lujinxingii]MBC3177898.1 DUF4191 domain-containing protein [Corynebacterium lujinxingii]NNO09859.1 DUF4191 family protein [Corynebacterium lujinxingii]QNP89673.1 DUF4191 domain-containing protein [Corynebacterium lujinxingii]